MHPVTTSQCIALPSQYCTKSKLVYVNWQRTANRHASHEANLLHIIHRLVIYGKPAELRARSFVVLAPCPHNGHTVRKQQQLFNFPRVAVAEHNYVASSG